MPILPNEELRRRVSVTIPSQKPYELSKGQKLENIDSFNRLSRDGLLYGVTERRLLLYETIAGEKLYMQYPGLESNRTGGNYFPYDARPVLQKSDGSFIADMDFKKIWDIIDNVGQNHRGDIDILATIFLRIAYMIQYQHFDGLYHCDTVNITTGNVLSNENIYFSWNALVLSHDIAETLNDRFYTIREIEGISLEGFLYYNDLLAQNEDCKYSFLKQEKWDIKTGRINNCLSHLTVISHIRGKIGISKLIDSFQRTGVAPLPQSRFSEACGDLVTYHR